VSVAVIGGGYAGMAAAVTLADAGVPVTVYEAASQLGGRARRVVVNGVALDNGLHILLGAYTETLRLVRRVRDAEAAFWRLPLQWNVHGRFRLKAVPLPAPLHLAGALLTARGASLTERFAAARFVSAMRKRAFALAHDTSVAQLLTAHRQGPAFIRYFWEPLCYAALNTPPRIASAQLFLNVLRDGLDGTREASDILLARVDLSALFPEPAANHVRERGGRIVINTTVSEVKPNGSAIDVRTADELARYDHVICAVSPHRANALLSSIPDLAPIAAMIAAFRYQPIYSVFLQFSAPVALPEPMVGLDGASHWVFDRGAVLGQPGLLGAVISASGSHQAMAQDELAARVHRELDRELGPLPPLAWHRVIAEKRATVECAVDLKRPGTRTPLRNVHLAGDYVASEYPPTIEAAVRSGVAASKEVLQRQL
jgi:squalene-associated FAD-dependent desaturase